MNQYEDDTNGVSHWRKPQHDDTESESYSKGKYNQENKPIDFTAKRPIPSFYNSKKGDPRPEPAQEPE